MTIALCSSAYFYKDILDIEEQLIKRGFKVKIPMTASAMKKNGNFTVFKPWYSNPEEYAKKRQLIDDHFKKIKTSDAVLVVNNEKNGISGYIGGNVLMEMTLAYILKKPIFLWNDVVGGLFIEEEVRALMPIVIEQDLARLKIR